MDSATINEIIKKNIYFVPTLELWNGVCWGDMAVFNLSEFYKAGGKIALGTDFAGYTLNSENRFVILTTEANSSMQAIHNRMHVILTKANAKYWLNSTDSARNLLLYTPPSLNNCLA